MILSAALALMFAGAADVKTDAKAPAKTEVKPHPVTITFHVANVECDGCVSAIADSLRKVKSVKEIKGLTAENHTAQISFDSHVSSFQQVAQAIADAENMHGKKFGAAVLISVPEYATGGNAAKVDAVFAKQAEAIKVECLDKAKGLFKVTFLPLKADAAKTGPQGFNMGKLGHPIKDEAPKGLGLKFAVVNDVK